MDVVSASLGFFKVVDLSSCSFVVPSFARVSAVSLSNTLQWVGIHYKAIVWAMQMEVRAHDRSFRFLSLAV